MTADPSSDSQPIARYRICDSADLRDAGAGVRFDLPVANAPPLSAFAVRYRGTVSAFLNQCAHVPVELDWQPGEFFDETGEQLICATHGATYRPSDGHCTGGPCRGRGLKPVRCFEADGGVFVEWPRPSAPI